MDGHFWQPGEVYKLRHEPYSANLSEHQLDEVRTYQQHLGQRGNFENAYDTVYWPKETLQVLFYEAKVPNSD